METELRPAADLRREAEEKERALISKQNQLKALYDATKTENGQRIVQPHQAEQIRTLEGTCAALSDQVNALKLDYMAARNEEELDRRTREPAERLPLHSTGNGNGSDEVLTTAAAKTRLPESIGQAFVDGASYKSWTVGGQGQVAHVEIPVLGMRAYALKATLTTATGPFTSIDKLTSVVTLGQQELTVADLLSQAQTSNTVIRYIVEDTFTNSAGMVAEGTAKPEQSWDLSEQEAPVRKIAVWSKVTEEVYADYPGLRDYINNKIPFAVRQREELQLLQGDGTGQNLLGVLNVPGILTQALVGNNIDTLYLAITKVRTQGFFEPDAVVIHPTNWSTIRLAKTTDGHYEYGPPSVAGPETIFGKRVVITANMPANTAVVGNWRMGGTIHYRQGIRVEATNSDQNDFIMNLVTVRAEQREAATWPSPKAFCTATGLTAA